MRICKVSNCDKKHFGRGYCQRHYNHIRKHGKIMPDVVSYKGVKCSVRWCTRNAYCNGMCTMHYNQILRYGKLLEPEIPTVHCHVHGCANRRTTKSLCPKHYYQLKNMGGIQKRTVMDPSIITVHGDIAFIQLCNKNNERIADATIDADWVDKCSGIRWGLDANGYVVGTVNGRRVLLHIYIIGKGMITDHKNGIRIDNRRCNLRKVNHQQNAMNSAIPVTNTTGVKGVHKDKRGRYKAEIICDGRKHRLGTFDTLEEAASARKVGAEKYHGKYAFEARRKI